MMRRSQLRRVHLVVGGVSAVLVYVPAFDTMVTLTVLRFALFPALLASGLALWKLAAIQRWRRGDRGGAGAR